MLNSRLAGEFPLRRRTRLDLIQNRTERPHNKSTEEKNRPGGMLRAAIGADRRPQQVSYHSTAQIPLIQIAKNRESVFVDIYDEVARANERSERGPKNPKMHLSVTARVGRTQTIRELRITSAAKIELDELNRNRRLRATNFGAVRSQKISLERNNTPPPNP